MNNQPSDASESLWRRKPSEAEQAELRTRPELKLEARLTDTLARMPNAQVPSNFTARVLNAVDLEEARASRKGWHWNWRSLLPRAAVAAALLAVVGTGIQHYETKMHRVELAKDVATVAAKQPMPSVDALVNLDMIQHIGAANRADGELLAALQ